MNGRKRLSVAVFAVLLCMLIAVLVLSAPDLGVAITKPLNQNYTYTNHTVNVTTNPGASSCRYMLGASSTGETWVQANASAGWAARYWHALAVAPNGTMWLVGGHDGSTYYNDIWYSTNGDTWTQANASAAFEGRYGHGFVIKSDGSMWIMGGLNSSGSKLNDIWNSTNGVDWTLVNRSAAWESRNLLQAVITSDDVMWIIGGQNDSGSNFILGDVWNSSNGADWRLVNSTAFLGRREFDAVTGTNNRLWVMGGYAESGSYLNDVWYSDNGIAWQAPNASAEIPWGRRKSLASAFTPSDGRIWISGGYNPDTAGYRNDVWFSQDGANWTQANASAGGAQRQDHQLAVMRNGTMIVAGGYYGATTNDTWLSAAPVAMDGATTAWGKEFNATEGSNFISVECNDTANVWNGTNVSFTVDTVLPTLVFSSPTNTTYNGLSPPAAVNATVSETASSCVHSLNGAANVTMAGSGTEWGKEFTPAEGSNRISVSCNDSAGNRNSTSVSFSLDSIRPVINMSSPLNQTYSTTSLTVNATTNETASSCNFGTNTDGKDENWTRVNGSAFSARNGHTVVNTSGGAMWLIGGTYNDGVPVYRNDVWNSTDGISWTLVNSSAAFSERAYHTSVVDSSGAMWVIAGFNGNTYFNDTWYSTNGAVWTRANASAFPGRYGHSSVVDSTGKIWVIAGLLQSATADPPVTIGSSGVSISGGGGGGTPTPTNTTWYSTDGISWRQANASAFPIRYRHATTIDSSGRMWVLGGIGSGSAFLNDAWHSTDGISWTMANVSTAWSTRAKHSAVSAGSNIFIMGGTDGSTTPFNDMWYSSNGANWAKVNNSNSSWGQRYDSAALSLNSKIWMIAGFSGVTVNELNDTWSTDIPIAFSAMDGSGITWGKNFTVSTGSTFLKVKCYDTAGNPNSTSVWLSVSLGFGMNITKPMNTTYATSSLTVNATTDASVSQCSYSLNHAANVSMDGATTAWGKEFTASNGNSIITVSCNDSSNNWNISSVSFSDSFAVCGNNVCETGETTSSCAADCPAAAASSVGGSSTKQADAPGSYQFDLKKDAETVKQIAEKEIAVKEIAIDANEDVKNVVLKLEKYEELPKAIKKPEGEIYQALEIKLTKEVSIKEAKICFDVENKWIEENDFKKEEVKLAHYSEKPKMQLVSAVREDGTLRASVKSEEVWEELPTNIVEPAKEEDAAEKTSYCAKTTGFSTYAIIARKEAIKEAVEEAKPVVEAIKEQIETPEAMPLIPRQLAPFVPTYAAAVIDVILIIFALAINLWGSQKIAEYEARTEYKCLHLMKNEPAYRKVYAFAKKSLRDGYPKSEIRRVLLEKGINEECVDIILASALSALGKESVLN
ncbi:MAG TPA: PGF-pre-PGF domain-containing protein [Nanoarchaeota archaeon]|nr:PGF-pre-PGF domain-containing protein [Nanoarchaeota archaeon]